MDINENTVIKVKPARNPYKYWTPEQLKNLVLLVDGTRSYREIAKIIGRTESSCQWRGEKMGLRNDFMPKKYSVDEAIRNGLIEKGEIQRTGNQNVNNSSPAPLSAPTAFFPPVESGSPKKFTDWTKITAGGKDYYNPVYEAELPKDWHGLGAEKSPVPIVATGGWVKETSRFAMIGNMPHITGLDEIKGADGKPYYYPFNPDGVHLPTGHPPFPKQYMVSGPDFSPKSALIDLLSNENVYIDGSTPGAWIGAAALIPITD